MLVSDSAMASGPAPHIILAPVRLCNWLEAENRLQTPGSGEHSAKRF